MELIDKIVQILINAGYKSQYIDFQYDSQGEVFGYISDEKFLLENRRESLKKIWDILNKHLPSDERVRIKTILIESIPERIDRMTKQQTRIENKTSRIWLHDTKHSGVYWMFKDVRNLRSGKKAFFLIINESLSYKKGYQFNFSNEVIKFMKFGEETDILLELHSFVFEKAQKEIKLDLMNRYEEVKNTEHLFGDDNRFSYVFKACEIQAANYYQIRFTDAEIELLKRASKYYSKYSINEDINNAIERSEALLASQKELII